MKRILDKFLGFCASRICEKRYCGYEYSNFEKWFSFGLISALGILYAFLIYKVPAIGGTIAIISTLVVAMFEEPNT
jgi:hypothetical protein